MASKINLVTPLISGAYEHELFRYQMDSPADLPYDTSLPLMLDIETHKTNYSDIRTVQLYQATWDKAIIIDTNDWPIHYIYSCIKDMHVVIHNATFEISCFQSDLKPSDTDWIDYRPVNPFKKFSDTFLLARQVMFRNGKFGLDAVAAVVHGVDYYQEYAKSLGYSTEEAIRYKKTLQKSFLDSPKSDKRNQPLHLEQLVYAAYDVLVMPKIYNDLKYFEDEFIIQIDYKFINWCTEYQWNGLPLDHSELARHTAEQEILVQESVDFLPMGFNPRSYKQVRDLLDTEESDDSFLASVVDGSDTDIYNDNPEHLRYRKECASKIRQIRSAYKRLEYIRAYKLQLSLYGRVKGFVSPRTISGRIAADEVNTLQIPRSLKSIFGFNDGEEGFLTYADYSQLELRMLAAVLDETVMVDKFMNDEDLHVYSGGQIYDKSPEFISKRERFIGKFFNFSGAYGAGAARMCAMLMKEAGIYMTVENMRPMLRKWKNGFPALRAWHAYNGRSKTMEDRTLSGRKYKANLYTDLNAIKMQGSSAEVFKLAHLYMHKSMGNIPISNAIHDSFIGSDKTIEAARLTGDVLGKSMVVAWFEIIQNSKVPTLKMPVKFSSVATGEKLIMRVNIWNVYSSKVLMNTI